MFALLGCYAVNLIIFVLWWLTVIGFNCFVAYHIIA